MTEKHLGKNYFAEFGTIKDYPCDKTWIGDGGKYMVNINPACRWETSERTETVTQKVEFVNDILNATKVNYVSELINKPVEVTIENNCFKDFQILTEVL